MPATATGRDERIVATGALPAGTAGRPHGQLGKVLRSVTAPHRQSGTEAAAAPADATGRAAPAEKIRTFASLRLRDFRLLLLGTTLSNAAQWIQQVTLGWLVYDLTASGTMLGTINLVRAAATLGLAPLAGVAIDRFARRTLMLVVNGWLFTISLTLGLALLAGQTAIWPLFVFTFLGGVAHGVEMPLRQTVVFTLVPRQLEPNPVALVQTG